MFGNQSEQRAHVRDDDGAAEAKEVRGKKIKKREEKKTISSCSKRWTNTSDDQSVQPKHVRWDGGEAETAGTCCWFHSGGKAKERGRRIREGAGHLAAASRGASAPASCSLRRQRLRSLGFPGVPRRTAVQRESASL